MLTSSVIEHLKPWQYKHDSNYYIDCVFTVLFFGCKERVIENLPSLLGTSLPVCKNFDEMLQPTSQMLVFFKTVEASREHAGSKSHGKVVSS